MDEANGIHEQWKTTLKVYAGLGNGSVMEFDVQNPESQDCVSVLICPQQFGVQSLICGQDHLYGCTRQTLFRWDRTDECSTVCSVPGSIESLAHDSLNNYMSASIRPVKPQGQAIHEVWNLSSSSIQKVLVPHKSQSSLYTQMSILWEVMLLYEFCAAWIDQILFRQSFIGLWWTQISTLTGHRSYNTRTKGCFVGFQGLPPMFASGDEEDNSLCLWNIKSNLIFRRIKCYEPIIQVHSQLVHGQPYLAALSASGLSVFACHWCNSRSPMVQDPGSSTSDDQKVWGICLVSSFRLCLLVIWKENVKSMIFHQVGWFACVCGAFA